MSFLSFRAKLEDPIKQIWEGLKEERKMYKTKKLEGKCESN